MEDFNFIFEETRARTVAKKYRGFKGGKK